MDPEIPVQEEEPQGFISKLENYFNTLPQINKTGIIIVLFVIGALMLWLSVSSIINGKLNQSGPIITPTPDLKPTVTQPVVTKTQEQEIILIKGELKKIPETDISLIYISSTIPGKDCYDCISSTEIEARKTTQKQNLIYDCGGISGECTTNLSAFDYKVELVRIINENSIVVKVGK